MEHTPIPWKLDSKPTDYPQTVTSNDGTVVALTGDDRANATFIVRAVNNHAKLLAALENMLVNPNYYGKKARAAIEEARK
ncbi:hypothetical protein LCGC14_1811000 [marine sediment metagenome]|uniref:Uncharacterized protein n=1 Tax=marine sediment metagenome TaxID=412755 RepID=A0A0F9GLN3_9ZZZZ